MHIRNLASTNILSLCPPNLIITIQNLLLSIWQELTPPCLKSERWNYEFWLLVLIKILVLIQKKLVSTTASFHIHFCPIHLHYPVKNYFLLLPAILSSTLMSDTYLMWTRFQHALSPVVVDSHPWVVLGNLLVSTNCPNWLAVFVRLVGTHKWCTLITDCWTD